MIRAVAAFALAAALAGCGVKAAPRPPERLAAEPRERRAAAAPAGGAEGCSCALPDPLLAASTRAP